jgi:hypothetical protein
VTMDNMMKQKIRQLAEQFSEIEQAWARMHDGACMLGIQQEYHEAFRGMMKLYWAISRARTRYNRELRAEAKQRAANTPVAERGDSG